MTWTRSSASTSVQPVRWAAHAAAQSVDPDSGVTRGGSGVPPGSLYQLLMLKASASMASRTAAATSAGVPRPVLVIVSVIATPLVRSGLRGGADGYDLRRRFLLAVRRGSGALGQMTVIGGIGFQHGESGADGGADLEAGT
ncbi:hypothetical protein [Streptomyces mirabilis]|uniref:hypothetical protein n=1 Tax=Streptomyces mirabilis TaxID=68239 RepID=UPI0036B9BEB1